MVPGKRQARSFPTMLAIVALMALPLATPLMAAPDGIKQAPAEANWWTAVLDQFLGFLSPQPAESSSLMARQTREATTTTTVVAVPLAPEPEDPPRGEGGEGGGEGSMNCCPGGGGGGGENGGSQDPNGG